MTNKSVVIINSLKVPKIKKILLYEMKFLVPNYSCLVLHALVAGLMARSQYSEGPATGHLGTGFSWFLCV
jgi:hypothetical protein